MFHADHAQLQLEPCAAADKFWPPPIFDGGRAAIFRCAADATLVSLIVLLNFLCLYDFAINHRCKKTFSSFFIIFLYKPRFLS